MSRGADESRGRPLLSAAGLAVAALALLVPLVVTPGRIHGFTAPKLLVAESLGLLSLLLLALAAARGEIEVSGRRIWTTPAFRAVAPILLVATVGRFFTEHGAVVEMALAELWIGALCLVGWSACLGRERLRRSLGLLVPPALAMAVLAVLQYTEVFQPFEFRAASETGRLGATALAGNAAALGAFLVLPLLVSQLDLGGARRASRKIGWSLALAALVAGLLVTQTLTAVVAAVTASLALWILLRRGKRLVIGVLAGLAAVVLLVALFAPLRERVVQRIGLLEEGEFNVLLTGRLDGWRAAAWMLRQHPASGVGHGAYRTEFAAAKLALADEGVPFYRSHLYPTFVNAHNDFLEAAAEWGVPGALALLWGLGLTARTAWRRSREEAPTAALAWAGLVALALLSVAHFPWRLALTAYPGLLFLAWLFAERGGAEK